VIVALDAVIVDIATVTAAAPLGAPIWIVFDAETVQLAPIHPA
jgi:hypothetical protein